MLIETLCIHQNARDTCCRTAEENRINRFLVFHRFRVSGACSDARLAFLCPYFNEMSGMCKLCTYDLVVSNKTLTFAPSITKL